MTTAEEEAKFTSRFIPRPVSSVRGGHPTADYSIINTYFIGSLDTLVLHQASFEVGACGTASGGQRRGIRADNQRFNRRAKVPGGRAPSECLQPQPPASLRGPV